MPQTPILDALADTENLLQWTRSSARCRGLDTKLENPRERVPLSTFCYGCNSGQARLLVRFKAPTGSRCLVNQRHIAEDCLDEAITTVINAYNNFLFRVSGAQANTPRPMERAGSVRAEPRLRVPYATQLGGIGSTMCPTTTSHLFSHSIPCGVWEAVHILDGLFKNESDIQPDTLHADTRGNRARFALAYLLHRAYARHPQLEETRSCRPAPKVAMSI